MRQIISIAFAYVGIIVGAGLSSGQDIVQYFLSFGIYGLVAIAALGVVHIIFGRIILVLGSYYQSREHTEVLSRICPPVVVSLIDASLVLSNFVIAFVMIAGAGANLNQQFGLPYFVGAALCCVLILVVSRFDFEKITQVLGIFTPILLVLIVIILIFSVSHMRLDFDTLNQIAEGLPRAMPNPALSTINYYALCAMTGVSMAFVLGGSILRLGIASRGGALGGGIIGLIMLLVGVSLFTQVDVIQDAEIPMLAIANAIHPLFANVYTLLIFSLLFNTAFSLDYALARRLAPESQRKQNLVLFGIVGVSFICSFAGFKKLVSLMYPILGYIGLFLLVVLAYAYVRLHPHIVKEMHLRRKMIAIFARVYDSKRKVKPGDAKKFNEAARASEVDTLQIKTTVAQRVKDVLGEELEN